MSDELTELGFEEALQQLEATVAELEAGQLPLEQALEKFEVAIRLQKRCAELLTQAETKIEELTESPEEESPEEANE
jgi:exodeoxyribonuclease VII small subunit